MSQSANVRAIDVLDDLRVGLVQFRGDIAESLRSAERVIQQTNEWLDERNRHWRRKVEMDTRRVSQAQAALTQCQNSGYRDKDGRVHQPDCSGQQRTYTAAVNALRTSQNELANVQRWTRAVGQAAVDYQRQAQAMKRLCDGELTKATTFLQRQSTTLHAYIAVHQSAGQNYAQAASDLQEVMDPTSDLRMTNAITNAIGGVFVGAIVAAVAATLIATSHRRIRPEAAETLRRASTSGTQDFDELIFPEPKQGFQRAFVGRHISLVVLKSAQKDEFTMMFGPVPQRISDVTREMGLEHTHTVAIHIQSDEDSADIYQRAAEDESWETIERNVRFRETLLEVIPDVESTSNGHNPPYHQVIRDVPLAAIDLSDSPVSTPADFKKVAHEQMRDGIQKLEDVVRPAVLSGKDDDYFAALDAERGLAYEHGYQRVYDAFYGGEAIRLDQDGDRYTVTNGYHRLLIARQQGLSTVPAFVVFSEET